MKTTFPISIKKALAATAALSAAFCFTTLQGCGGKGSAASEAGEDSGMPTSSAGLTYAKGWTELEVDANSAKNTLDSAGHYHTDRNQCQQAGDGVYEVQAWNTFASLLNQAAAGAQLQTPRCEDSPSESKFYNRGVAVLVDTNSPPAPIPGPQALDGRETFDWPFPLPSFSFPFPGSSPRPTPVPSSAPSPSPPPSPSPSLVGARRMLFEYKNGQICSYVADPGLSNVLMEQIETMIRLSDAANAMECPGYRPPGA